MTFAAGSLVRARGREWVVLPESQESLLILRPLGGTDDEVTGILTSLEEVAPAQFDLPDPSQPGDFRSGRLLQDALRLGFRSSAGPFRSFGQLGVDPRPYQLVPLLMALKLETVRMLIADDVGIGKTIEAGLIAKELIAQGDATRLAVLTPPHLAEQWQKELREKFNIDAELVLASTAGRLERDLPLGTSLFDVYPFVVVSIDFIKSDKYRDEFVRTCPELVIVDEAHGCTMGAEKARQQRHQLVSQLAKDKERHMILVTATPHSGKEDAFGSLLGLLDPALESLPGELVGEQNKGNRKKLAQHLIQRRRADIEHYLGTDTHFPVREEAEETYELTPEYRALFDKVLAYARETVRDPEGGKHRQRVRWWAALSMLRSLASSPAAAAETLRNRAASADTKDEQEADDIGRRMVFDVADEDGDTGLDVPAGADVDDSDEAKNSCRLREMAREADALKGKGDAKIQKGVTLIGKLVKDGYRPIVFCRFIPTADYVAEQLREALGKNVEVLAVTGKLPAAEREQRVLGLSAHKQRVLVATDCLSEGINLQDHFDAVVHYDLSWNPTRHEQREGRVDRFGQEKPTVRTLTYYGTDNQIDGIVLEVLLRKSKTIRKQTGVSVPVPNTESVMEAVFEGLLLREESGSIADRLPGFDEFFRPKREDLFTEWEQAADREKKSHSLFAQETLKPDEVERELRETREAVGGPADVERFVRGALTAHGAVLQGAEPVSIDISETPVALRDLLGLPSERIAVRFDPDHLAESEIYLSRTSHAVEGLASYVLNTALDPQEDSVARRCAVVRTDAVATRTTLLLLRFRFDVITKQRGGEDRVQLAEDAGLVAFKGSPIEASWLRGDDMGSLLEATPTGNAPPEVVSARIGDVVESIDALRPALAEEAGRRATALHESLERVREAARQRGV